MSAHRNACTNSTHNYAPISMTEISVYAQRRDRLQALMQRGIAVIPTAPEQRRNGDADYPYRFDSSFYYLSGFSEPEAVLVLVAGQADQPPQSILFCREKNLEREIWDGYRYGPGGGARSIRFRCRLPRRATGRKAGRTAGQPAHAVLSAGRGCGLGPAHPQIARCRRSPSAQRHQRPKRAARCARPAQ